MSSRWPCGHEHCFVCEHGLERAASPARSPAPPDPAPRCDGRPASSATPASPTGGGAPRLGLFAGIFAAGGAALEQRARAWLCQADDGELAVLAARLSTLPLPVLLRVREHLADAINLAIARES